MGECRKNKQKQKTWPQIDKRKLNWTIQLSNCPIVQFQGWKLGGDFAGFSENEVKRKGLQKT